MKLGTKIVAGFVATNIIYVALSIIIFLSAQPVRKDSTTLSQDLLPMLDQASVLQYSTAMEGYMTQQYSYGIDPEIWVEALTYNADVIKYMWLMEENVKNSPALQSEQIRSALTSLRLNYQAFRDLAEIMPTRLQAINSDLESITYGHENFKAALKAAAVAEGRQGLDSGRVAMINELEGLANSLVVSVVRARFEGDPGEFSRGYDYLERSLRLAEELAAGAPSQNAGQAAVKINELLKEVQGTLKNLEATLKTADEESARRVMLADETIKNAAALRQAADKESQRVAQGSTATLERVIWSLAVGVLVVLVLSTILSSSITRGITRPINHLIGDLSDGAMQVDQAAGELSKAANELDSGARNNTASLQDVSSALDELSSMTELNTGNSLEANNLMIQVTGAVERADQSMARVIEAMKEISTSGSEIAKIIGTIDEIAFQTNLLALNAAVEAARAGEAGAGFAVVAEEVRNLATRSAEAAKNTADLIAATIGNIDSGSEMVSLTAQNFQTVETHAAKVAQLLTEVAQASREQSQGIGQINHSMQTMDEITRSNASAATESAKAADSLYSQAAGLLTAVDGLNGLVHGSQSGRPVPAVGRRLLPAPSRK